MLLLYCMTEAGVASGEVRGVHGAEVLSVEEDGVRCYFSGFDAEKKGNTQDDALAFWTVIDELFQKTSVIPFRYPTLMADEATVREFLAANGSAYFADLQRIHGQVQVKIMIRQSEAESAEKAPSSGTEYLKRRQRVSQAVEAAMVVVTAAGDGIVKEWKESQKKEAKILFALIERSALGEFKKRISQLKDSAAEINFSGPWPPAEFVNCSPEVKAKP